MMDHVASAMGVTAHRDSMALGNFQVKQGPLALAQNQDLRIGTLLPREVSLIFSTTTDGRSLMMDNSSMTTTVGR